MTKPSTTRPSLIWTVLGATVAVSAALAVLVWAAIIVWHSPNAGITWSMVDGNVFSIVSGSAADRAGVVPGDTVLTLDGVPLARAARVYTAKRAGDRITFGIRRGSKVVSVTLVLSPVSLPDRAGRMSVLAAALGFMIVGFMVLALRPRSGEARRFFVLAQAGAICLALGRASTYGLEGATRGFNAALCVVGSLLVDFHTRFPQDAGDTPARSRWVPGLRSAVLGAGVVLGLPYALVSLTALKASGLYAWLYTGTRIYIMGATGLALVLLVRSAYSGTDRRARARLRPILVGTAAGLLPFIGLSLVPSLLWGRPLVASTVTLLGLLWIPVAYAYAVYRHNLFDTDRIFNRSLVAFLLVLLWGGLYLAAFELLRGFFPVTTASPSWIGVLLVLLMALTTPDLKAKLESVVDRLLYGGWYDYQGVISRFSAALNATLDTPTLVTLLTRDLPATLHLRCAALLLPEPASGPGASGESPEGQPETWRALTQLSSNDGDCAIGLAAPLIHTLSHLRKPVPVAYLRETTETGTLPAQIAGASDPVELELCVPIVLDETLEGVLLLGSKEADDTYTKEDIAILETLAHQAATTIRNARLVDALRHHIDVVTRGREALLLAHRRLLGAREEERQRLARDLHDGPLQALLGLSYQLRAQSRSAPDPAGQRALESLRRDVLATVREIRHLCTHLRPPALDLLGLPAAMVAHAEDLEDRSEAHVHLDVSETPTALPDVAAISVFRLYQEALHNALRHSRAETIHVCLRITDTACHLRVTDDGCGFRVPLTWTELAQRGHFGLLGIQERVDALSGTLKVQSAPGMGTTVDVWFPLDSEGDESDDEPR